MPIFVLAGTLIQGEGKAGVVPPRPVGAIAGYAFPTIGIAFELR
jgi:hypothetical protein